MKLGRKPSKYGVKFWEALPHGTQRPIGSILESIDALTKESFVAIQRQDGSEIEKLSQAVAKMPAYLQGLGYYLADAEFQAAQAKDDYELLKLAKERAAIDDSKSVAEAERIAGTDGEVVLKRDKWRDLQHNFRVLRLKYDATEKQISGWQSRLATVRNELRAGV